MNMKIKRLLNDKSVVKGDQLFDIKGQPFKFVEVSGGQLTIMSSINKTARKRPSELGCYLLNKNKTERGLAKERLRSYWDD